MPQITLLDAVRVRLQGQPVCLDIDLDKTPPTEFRIFKAGTNPSTKGPFLFDEKAASSVMGLYEKMGRRVTFDYDHGVCKEHCLEPRIDCWPEADRCVNGENVLGDIVWECPRL